MGEEKKIMGEETIRWRLDIDGAQPAAQNLAAVGTSFDDLEKKTSKMTQRFTGVASASSALGTAMSRLDPRVGSLISAFGSAGAAASGLRLALGGVAGLVGGALIAALGIGIQYFNQMKTAAEELEERTDRVRQSVEKLITQYKTQQAEAERAYRISTNNANQEDLIYQRSSALRVQNMLEENKQAADNYVVESRLFTLIEKQKAKVLEYDNKIIALAKEANKVDIKWTEDAAGAGAGAGKRGNAGAKTDKFGDMTNQLITENRDMVGEMIQDRRDAEQQYLDEWYEIELLKSNAREEIEQQSQRKITKMRMEGLRRRQAAEQQANAILASMTQRYVDTSANVMAQGLNALAQGKELAIGQIISAIGSELVAAGTRDILQAAAFFFNPYMMAFAPGLLAAGGAEIAVGMGMGAAGSAINSSTQSGSASATPSSPTPQSAIEERERETGPVVINIHTLRADEDTGRAIQESLDKYQKRHGKAASLGRFV